MARLIILTGASGSGKTTIVRRLQERVEKGSTLFLHFDSIGVPPVADMIRDFGSPEGWQKAKTIEWIQKIKTEFLESHAVVFEGQTRIRFLREALAAHPVSQSQILLIDCGDEVRKRRLSDDRGQPELADDNMMGWAKFLRDEAVREKCLILDSSQLSVDESCDRIEALLEF